MSAIVKTLKPKPCLDLDRVGVGGFQALCENRMGEELPLNYYQFLLNMKFSIFWIGFYIFFSLSWENMGPKCKGYHFIGSSYLSFFYTVKIFGE